MDNDFFDALIFDMDGTLWDATATYAEEWNETARRMGVPDFHITPEQLHQYMGLSIDKIFNAILSKCTLDPVEFCRVVDGVEDAEVTALKQTNGDDTLIAFLTGQVMERKQLVKRLSRHLKPWEIPSRFMVLPAIPRTSTGKADRKKLEELAGKPEG